MMKLRNNRSMAAPLIDNFFTPQLLADEKDFLLVYKPPRMHAAPQASSGGGETMLDWCVARFPEVADITGRKEGEGGLLHRLDYDTHGLMLIARNSKGMEALLAQQKDGRIIKEYSALTAEKEVALPGFPKERPCFPTGELTLPECENGIKLRIESAFRPYGPGRKAVRPVLSGGDGKLYMTEILECRPVSEENLSHYYSFKLRLRKGFRHQIRCHLAWLGLPILNDCIYGGPPFGNGGLLALRAISIAFIDPSSGQERSYSIPDLSAALI